MTVIAALTGPLPKVGIVVIALLAAGSLLARDQRRRATAMLAALVLAPVLLLADIWHSPQLHLIHRHPLYAVVGGAAVLAFVGAIAVVINRRPAVLGALAIAALPFRIPIQAAGRTSNLLVPLYLVVAAGALAFIVPAMRDGEPLRASRDEGPEPEPWRPGWIERLLALYIVVYGIQAVYSTDFEKALQQMVFFYVPFTLLFCLLAQLQWTRGLVRTCVLLLAGLAVVFACIGFAEYATKTIILNPKLVVTNDLHTYFTVNSVFFDPDIFGRFLALVMISIAVLLLYDEDRRRQLGVTGVLAVLWAGLVLTLSRSSLAALLVGLGTLAALRWRVSRALFAAAAVVALGAALVAITPTTFGLNQGANGASSGRANLVSGGLHLFADRPLWGFGSGSFEKEYRAHHPGAGALSASHTIPVTIAAEQGLIGELAYLALVIVAIVVLLRGARGDPTRAAIAAAFLALMFHTMLYADFLEDPVTWALLGAGTALARVAPRPEPARRASRAGAVAPAPA
jgi:putative inorganic carbon (hco3(-)) transporter